MDSQQSERLLTYLKNSPLLDGYSLTIYSTSEENTAAGHLCSTRGIPHLCHKICQPYLKISIDEALSTNNAVFFICPLGLFSFAVPVSTSSCLVCSGVRENLFDLYFYRAEKLEFLKEKNVYPFEILEQLEKLPVSTEKEVRETMSKVVNLVASFNANETMQSVDSSTNLQNTFMDVAASIGQAESFDKAVTLFGEMFGILFDVPAIALVLKDEESSNFIVEICWGPSPGTSSPFVKALPFQAGGYRPVFLGPEELEALIPGNKATSATCLPLFDDTDLFGMAVLFDISFPPQKLSLCELLTSRLVVKIKEKNKEREAWRKQRVDRLLKMVRTLVLTENHDDLLNMIMTMAAELVDASSGSLMISDKSGRILRVVSALGMNPVLARSISTKKGKGIAGMVAASGTPLLVTDIEQDRCFGRPNRIRFSTKSCISLPLQFKETTIGVLNLADKKNGTPFIPSDQEILCTFLEQATIILGRSNALRKAKLNSITDPLTGLYNMRFLKKRFNEELSRSIRHSLNLTLIILSLDNISRQQGPRERGQTQMTVKKTARILTSSLRDIDLVGRSSEVEFCLILPATPKKEGAFVAERIIRAVTEGLAKDDDLSGGQSVHISAGIAFYPEDGASSADLIKVARNGISPRVTNLVGKSVPPTTNMTARTSSSVLTSA